MNASPYEAYERNLSTTFCLTPCTNSWVVALAASPLQERPTLMPNRLWLVCPLAVLISRLPQPDSSAAWPRMKCGGRPVAFEASTACGHILSMKLRALVPGAAPGGGAGIGSAGAADVGGVACSPAPCAGS